MFTTRQEMHNAVADHSWLHFYQMSQLQEPGHQTILVRGDNARVWDQHGREYIDALAGLFCVNVGYGRSELVEAAARQMQEIGFVSPFSFPNVPAAQLAAQLASRGPLGPGARAFFTAGGSEAVESALKIVKQAQRKRGFAGRAKVLARRYAYHGSTMGALSVTGWASIRQPFEPLVPGARHVPIPHRYRCRACALAGACTGACTDEIEAVIEFEGPDSVAAIILEPVQNAGGAIVPPPGYYRAVRQMCDHYGIMLIMDEVVTAFGRLGALFGSRLFEVSPDVITLAKGMTSGYIPMGAALVRQEIADEFLGDEHDKLLHGLTYGGHPVGAAVALENLAIIEREALDRRARTMGNYLKQELHAALDRHPNVGEVRGMGMLMAIELVRDRETKQPLQEENLMSWLSQKLQERGVICHADDRLDPVIQLAPPLTIPREDVDRVVDVIAEVLGLLDQRLGSIASFPAPVNRANPPAGVAAISSPAPL